MPVPDAQELRSQFDLQSGDEARAIVQKLAAIAWQRGGVYLAGGAVRDLLLDRGIFDIDLVVECDAIDLVREALTDVAVTTHARFRTVSLRPGGTRIDVATARRERYAQPGALPQVEPAGIQEDLLRRDFSINAIALRLDAEPLLLDPAGGVADIERRFVRVLHNASFADDATRIFRACRYAARLGFAIEAHTEQLLRDGVGYLATIGGERLRRELELTLAEESAGAALEACDEYGALRALHETLSWDAAASAAYSHAVARAAREEAGFAMLARGVSADDASAIERRLSLKRAQAAAVRGMAAITASSQLLERPDAKPSGVVVLLDQYPPATVAAFAALHTDSIAGQLALRYLDEWRHVRPLTSGTDLQALGVPAGPQIQRGLQLIRAARLDGWASDRGDEQALALRFAKSIRDSAAMTSPLQVDMHDRRN